MSQIQIGGVIVETILIGIWNSLTFTEQSKTPKTNVHNMDHRENKTTNAREKEMKKKVR